MNQPPLADDGVPERTTRTYRLTSRLIRTLEAAGTPPAELADLVRVRERAYSTLLRAAHEDLARTLVEEDAFLLRMRACREAGGDGIEDLRRGLGHVRARMRALLTRAPIPALLDTAAEERANA